MKKSFATWSGQLMFFLVLSMILNCAVSPAISTERKGPGLRQAGPGEPGKEGFGGRGRGPMGPPDGVREEIEKLAPEQREELGRLRSLSETYRQLSDIAKEEGKVDEAISWAKKILGLTLPDFAPEGVRKMAERGKGMINMFIYHALAEAGRDSEAAGYLEEAGKSNLPGFMIGEMYNKMGEKFLKDGNREKARDYFEKAAKTLEK